MQKGCGCGDTDNMTHMQRQEDFVSLIPFGGSGIYLEYMKGFDPDF